MSNASTRIPGTRNLSASQSIAFKPKHIGLTVDMASPKWAGVASATGIRSGLYTVGRYSIGGDKSRPAVILVPADAATSSGAALATAERAVARFADKAYRKAYLARAEASAQKRLDALRAAQGKGKGKGKA